MHQCISLSGRIHACTGPVAYSKRIGLLFKPSVAGVKFRTTPVRLGKGLQPYHIRSDLSPVWDAMDRILKAASAACSSGDFRWPTSASSPEELCTFASKSKAWLADAWNYSTFTEYGVLNGVRKMMHVAVHSFPEDVFDKCSMSQIAGWVPDENAHCTPLEEMTGHQARKMFNLSPLWIACHTCFLESVDSSRLKKVLRMQPGDLLKHAYKAQQEKGVYMSPLVVLDIACPED